MRKIEASAVKNRRGVTYGKSLLAFFVGYPYVGLWEWPGFPTLSEVDKSIAYYNLFVKSMQNRHVFG
jgi:hypothetical protein